MLPIIAALAFAATPLPTPPSQGYCYGNESPPRTYNVVTGCSNTPPPPQPGRYLTGAVQFGTNGGTVLADLTTWLWSRGVATDPPKPWPGVNGAHVQILAIPRASYIALAFNTDGYKRSGMFSTIPDDRVPKYDICITRSAGDFNPPADNKGACKFGALADGNVSLTWKSALGNAAAPKYSAMLASNSLYFVNIRWSQPVIWPNASAPVKLTHNYQ